MNQDFNIPIYYNEKSNTLNNQLMSELELRRINSTDIDTEEKPIYVELFKPTNKASSHVLTQMSKLYTTDTTFLKQTQTLVKSINVEEINSIRNKHGMYSYNINDVVSLFEEINNETGFNEKYSYIDWSFAKELNNNPYFLQIMSLYNIASPILALSVPIFVLVIPFVIIKIKGIEMSISRYIEILKTLIANNSIYKIFTEFNSVSNGQRIYMIFSAFVYLFSIYQNILACVRFYSNIQKINSYLFKIKQYLAYTFDVIHYYVSKTDKLTKYKKFNDVLIDYRNLCLKLANQLENISQISFSIKNVSEIGNLMHFFYQMKFNDMYQSAFGYTFGFNGYIDLMCQLSENVNNKKMNKVRFHKTPNSTIFKKMYYPKYINNEKDIVRNDFDLSKNIVLSGPNASGKTTTLKTAIINVIMSQQFGFGCFESLKLTPYNLFHCYLNIPDTSGRDSLFQAEARRCKQILTEIDENKRKRHFCIFDELYSGTNPDEAIDSGYAFIEFITKNKNVTCLLTTHYIELCKKLTNNKNILNCSMKTLRDEDTFKYTYEIEEGISEIRGGAKVLKDMDYPDEILNKI